MNNTVIYIVIIAVILVVLALLFILRKKEKQPEQPETEVIQTDQREELERTIQSYYIGDLSDFNEIDKYIKTLNDSIISNQEKLKRTYDMYHYAAVYLDNPIAKYQIYKMAKNRTAPAESPAVMADYLKCGAEADCLPAIYDYAVYCGEHKNAETAVRMYKKLFDRDAVEQFGDRDDIECRYAELIYTHIEELIVNYDKTNAHLRNALDQYNNDNSDEAKTIVLKDDQNLYIIISDIYSLTREIKRLSETNERVKNTILKKTEGALNEYFKMTDISWLVMKHKNQITNNQNSHSKRVRKN